MKGDRTTLLVMIIIAFVLFYLFLPLKDKPFAKQLEWARIRLGLDLQGGAEFVYKVASGKREDAIRAREIIERRLGTLKEPRINLRGDDTILIQIPGVGKDEAEYYEKLIGTTGSLELKEVIPKEEIDKYSEDAYEQIYFKGSGEKLYVKKEPCVVGRDIIQAIPDWQPGEGHVVRFELTGESRDRFAEVTTRLAKKGRIGIILDKTQGISAPTVESPITDGRGVITFGRGGTKQEAERLALILRSGALPSPIKQESKTFLGPTLGEDQLRRGIIAAIIAFCAVTVFMFIYYRSGGFVSFFAILMNLVLLIGVLTVFNATLTLPGLAGIVLTIGMGIDGCILIFERIREELARGRPIQHALETAFSKVTVTIMDANITTAIIALLLWLVGTGPVKAFGLVLLIGIMINMFTILVGTRALLRLLVYGGTIKQFKITVLFAKAKINFVKIFAPLFIVSFITVATCVLLFVFFVHGNLGIDFKGGVSTTFKLIKNIPIEQVRARLLKIKNPRTNLPKYQDLEVTQVTPPEEEKKKYEISMFQFRTSFPDGDEVKEDILTEFSEAISPGMSRIMSEDEVKKYQDKVRFILDEPKDKPGAGMYIFVVKKPKLDKEKVKEVIATALGKIGGLQNPDTKKSIYEKIEREFVKVGYKIKHTKDKKDVLEFTVYVPKAEAVNKIKDELKKLDYEFVPESFTNLTSTELATYKIEFPLPEPKNKPGAGICVAVLAGEQEIKRIKNEINRVIARFAEFKNPKTAKTIYMKQTKPSVIEFIYTVEKEQVDKVKSEIKNKIKEAKVEVLSDKMVLFVKVQGKKRAEMFKYEREIKKIKGTDIVKKTFSPRKVEQSIITFLCKVKKQEAEKIRDIIRRKIKITPRISPDKTTLTITVRGKNKQDFENMKKQILEIKGVEIIKESFQDRKVTPSKIEIVCIAIRKQKERIKKEIKDKIKEAKFEEIEDEVIRIKIEGKPRAKMREYQKIIDSIKGVRAIHKKFQHPKEEPFFPMIVKKKWCKIVILIPKGLEDKIEKLKEELKRARRSIKLSPGVFEDIPSDKLPEHFFPPPDRKPEAGFYFRIICSTPDIEKEVVEKIVSCIKSAGVEEKLYHKLEIKDVIKYMIPDEEHSENLLRFAILIPKDERDVMEQLLIEAGKRLRQKEVKEKIDFAEDPFTHIGVIGPATTKELRTTSSWALVLGCVLMLIYIAIRFVSFNFGIGAVVALVHDVAIAIGGILIIKLLLPRGLEFGFEYNLQTVAAALAIVGYSINDTIVVYDRVRENIITMRRMAFPEIINISMNQILSRSVMTSFTTWMTAAILYGLTMGTGSGIANLALPLVIGMIVGTYSSFFVAGPVTYWLFRGRKPEFARK